ncbi:MAG: fibronectin type III domain-containing protein [Eubacterium sp.]|nr:fibronectin type III domain-containing protein [Eubacterium sp.]
MNLRKGMALSLVLSMVLGMTSVTGSANPTAVAAEAQEETVSGSAVSAEVASGSATTEEAINLEDYRLAAPSSVTARGGSKRVRLTWTQVAGASGYCIYYRSASSSAYVKAATIAGVNATTYTKKSLEQSTKYYFYVVPYVTVNGIQVEGELSASVSATTGSVSATSKKAERYATKTKFKKSAAYKKYTKMKSYLKYNKCFAIPGMINTNVAGFGCKTMVPQGMTLAGSYFLITAYDYTGTDYSVIYVVSRASKSYITTIVLPSKAKVGGIAYDGSNIWVSKGKNVVSFPYSVITDAVNGGSSFVELSSYSTTTAVNGTASYMGYYNGILWVGSFSTTSGNMYGYEVNSAKASLTQKYTMPVPSKTQGISFASDGTLYLTRSYRVKASKSGYISQIRSYKPSYNNPSSTGVIKKNTALNVTKLPPKAEGVAVYGSYTYVLFSSTYYKSCKYPVDRVIAMKSSKLI